MEPEKHVSPLPVEIELSDEAELSEVELSDEAEPSDFDELVDELLQLPSAKPNDAAKTRPTRSCELRMCFDPLV